MTEPIKVDVWSDIACPFCYIGKRKFEAAVDTSGLAVEVEFHSFELAPDAVEEVSGTHAEMLAQKMGVSMEEALGMERTVIDAASAVGLTVDYDRIQPAKTRTAHQLLHYAKAHGRQAEMKERLLAAYFTEGAHVGQVPELADLAAQIGLDRDDVIRSLESEEHLPAVAADVQQARDFGIRGVPFFVIDGKYAVSGAQDPETFAHALKKAHDDKAAAV